MAAITILTPEEVAQRDQKPERQRRTGRKRSAERTRIIEAYKVAMREAEPGYGADVTLAPDEAKRQVRQNLKAAAQELNIALDFRPIKDRSRMHFQFITPEEYAAKAKRGGRLQNSAQRKRLPQMAEAKQRKRRDRVRQPVARCNRRHHG